MYYVPITESQHDWDKKNLMTIMGRKGGYDEVVCKNCGIKGRRYNLANVSVSETYSKKRAFTCPKAPGIIISKRIRITLCMANGKIFANLTPNSEHEVINPPKPYENDHNGVWVMGVGEPVKVLSNEFIEIKS